MNASSIAEIFASAADRFPEALCAEVDPDLFFSDTKQGRSMSKKQKAVAKSLCAHCVHQIECRDLSLANRERYGIWGGLDEEERLELLEAS